MYPTHLQWKTRLGLLFILFSLSLGFDLNTARAGNPDSLYYVCDSGDRLWIIHRNNGGKRDIGTLGVPDVEGIAYWPGTEMLYGADAGNFGSIHTTSGAFTSIGELDGGGTASGSQGAQTLDDVDGLSFDPWTGILWASNRRVGAYDLLFQIDVSTGQFIANAFGAGVDYLVIDGSGVFTDIDDIAISPLDGKMYTSSTQGGSGQILRINKYTGTVQVQTSAEKGDLEGLAFHNDGLLYGTTVVDTAQFLKVDLNTGNTFNRFDLLDVNCDDPESVAALVADINTVSGTVWDDLNLDGTVDGSEPGLSNVTVYLYYDKNGDGAVNLNDVLVQTTVTDGNGDYHFHFAAKGNLIVITDPTTLPGNYGYTTSNLVATEFTAFGQTNNSIHIGATTGTDSDGDGIPDHAEGTTADNDIDNIPDYLDIDSDNDGIIDAEEGLNDTDFDGIPDYLDLDSDNDGITDAIEANSGIPPSGYFTTLGRVVGTDTNGDGLLDPVDAGSGISTSSKPDTDGDGIDDYRDLDSDSDGILDLIEAGGTDADQDGRYDGFTDGNGDGYFDGSNIFPLAITNTDLSHEQGAGLTELPDYLDLDSDNDGITDLVEGFATGMSTTVLINSDCDFDGIVDLFDIDKEGMPAIPNDMDNDGIPDFRDTDSDNDGVSDAIEGDDADLNGTADKTPSGNDADNDGIDDTFDATPGTFGGNSNVALQNQDGDSEPDWRDRDDANNAETFYYVCDATDQLYQYNSVSQTSALIGPLGVSGVEAIAYWPSSGLYGANTGTFGSINPTTGAFNPIGEIDGGGTANGMIGPQTLNDVDGLSFDPWTGMLWATERKSISGAYDLLFQIDTATGLYIPNIFGPGMDYLLVDGFGVFEDVDDLAISPLNGQLYTVGNNGAADQLLRINKFTGTITVLDNLTAQDVEGMAYNNAGNFYGTVGTIPSVFYEINPVDGNMTGNVTLACADVEALAALVAPINTISGTVWEDTDISQTINNGETGISGVTVQLYYDTDADGTVSPGDVLLQTEMTDGNGHYSFEFATTANLVLQIDISTLPNGYELTTDNLETVVFTDNFNFGENDSDNNFGAANGTDCDGDGIPDFAEEGAGTDSDGDGIDNKCDLDSDNDGILDAIEGTTDTDKDGIPNYLDLDSDNDGIPDAIEANNGVAPTGYVVNSGRISGSDTDNDGLVDAVDADPATAYGAGSVSTLDNNDHDGDGFNDVLDLDSDNDGIYDVLEAGGTDADKDGLEDGFTDGNNDGIGDFLNTTPLPVFNTDNTGNPDYIDFDSDDDGLDDTLEGLSTAEYAIPALFIDADGDGIYDFWDQDFSGTIIQPVDTDGDGTPDYQDNDSDNDGVIDLIEGNDANMDGIQDYAAAAVDSDGDGMDDNFDAGCASGGGITINNTDQEEEEVSTGNVDLTSSDLELGVESSAQLVGIHFANVNIPQGGIVPHTIIQFEADEIATGPCNLTITGQSIANAPQFTSANSDISDRTTTTASVAWSPNDWNIQQEAGADQQTPDISSILQEIVNLPGWVSGNDIVIIISGTGTRTSETDPLLFIANNFWGCASNTPHQDSNSDGEDDWRDIDDDGDHILTADEIPDADGNGTPDYLEMAPCPVGFTEQTITTSGNADAVQASNLITDPGNALGVPDGAVAQFAGNNNAAIELDLTDTLSAGLILQVTWQKVSGGGNAELNVDWSLDGSSWTAFSDFLQSSSTSLITSNLTLAADTRFIRFRRKRRVPAVDGLAYSFPSTGCVPDFDQDGIPDADDEDDDNDGIPDVSEVGDKDGDGQPDATDLDSDNDGIPDAIEANSGELPANMNNEGQYPGGYVAINDSDGDGLANDVDPTTGGTPLPDTDTDSDGCVDRCSLDSDSDGITDAVEANNGILPANMTTNGQYPAVYATANDVEPDGLVDDVDADAGGTVLPNPDTDSDGIHNYQDLDSDGDGIADNIEGFTAVPALTGDNNGNCLDDAYETTPADLPDLDCNNIPDYLDLIITTVQSGTFTDPSTWAGGIVPTTSQSISIHNGHTVTLTGNTSVKTIKIDTSGTLEIENFTLNISGSLTVSGTFTATQGTVRFNGSGCPQNICGGNITFYNWETDNADGVNVTCGDICWTGVYTPTSGTLNTCNANSVKLVSTSTGTASVAGSGNGDFECDIIVERYKEGCFDLEGFFGLASPVDITFEQWNDDLILTGYTGSDFPDFPFNNTTWYEEPVPGGVNDGWQNPTNTTDSVERGRGYMIWQGPDEFPATIEVIGEPSLEGFDFPLTYTNHSNPVADGYNLLGNPYPASLRWDLTPGNGWVNAGTCDAIAIWDECNQQYSSYAGGVGVNGGTDIIAQSQAFWVKAHSPGASLQINRRAMVSDEGEFRNSAMFNNHQVFYLNIRNNLYYDQVALRLNDLATEGFDDGLESIKFFSLDSTVVPTIYAGIPDGADILSNSINAFPNDGQSRVVPIFTRVSTSGNYELDFTWSGDWPANLCLYIEDLQTGAIIDPQNSVSHAFTQNTTASAYHRFNVHFKYALSTASKDVDCYRSSDGWAAVEIDGTGPFDITWTDLPGNNLQTSYGTLASGDTLQGLGSGTYIVHVLDHGAALCASFTDTIYVAGPVQKIRSDALIVHAGCTTPSEGAININASGGTGPYTYHWSTGETTQDLSGLLPGTYTVTITDANHCSDAFTYLIEDHVAPVTASFTAPDTVYLSAGGFAAFNNVSQGATAYVWDFGDNTEVSVSPSPVHQFESPGTYQVMLQAYNGYCQNTLWKEVVVQQTGTSIPETSDNDRMNIFQHKGTVYIWLNPVTSGKIRLQITNSAGQTLYKEDFRETNKITKAVALHEASGIYYVSVNMNGKNITKKLALVR